MKKIKEGHKIIPIGVYPEKHEHDTADFFLKLGKDVYFIKPSRTKKTKNADVIIDGVVWEMKSPIGRGKENLEHAFKAAVKQSENIIFDLRRSKIPEQKALAKLQRELRLSKKAKRLLVITKQGEKFDFFK